MNSVTLTHDELVKRAVRWLAGTRRCYVVMDEQISFAVAEQPDAIGWRCGGRTSILVECKTSTSDFYADQRKHHRKYGRGMGSERWYMTPPGLLKPEQIPDGWGLVEVSSRCRIVVQATPRDVDTRDLLGELSLFMSSAVVWAKSNVRVFAVPEAEIDSVAELNKETT